MDKQQLAVIREAFKALACIADTYTGPAAERATHSCEKIERLFETMPTHGIARDLAEVWLEATGSEVKAR